MTRPAPAGHPDSPPPSRPTRAQRPAPTISGAKVVAATLSLFLIVPLGVVLIWFAFLQDEETPQSGEADAPLIYAQRADWPRDMYTLFKSLERGPMAAARTNETYEDLGFHLDSAHAAAVLRCVALAKDRQAFDSQTTREQLEAEVAALPDLFYAHYLLGSWHRRNGEAADAQASFAKSFAHAPAALLQRFVTPEGEVLAGRTVAPMAFVADQVVNDRLDRSVVLYFPFPTTDREGFVYLPVYKTILRRAEVAPTGLALRKRKPRWFTFYGRVGRLQDETVKP